MSAIYLGPSYEARYRYWLACELPAHGFYGGIPSPAEIPAMRWLYDALMFDVPRLYGMI